MKTKLCRILSAVFALSGAVAFAAGEVEVGNGSSANIYKNTSDYGGASKIIKTGTGVTTLDLGDMREQFKGEIEIREGELKVASTPKSFGAPVKITVASGATLDLSWSGTDTGAIPNAEIVIAGTGAASNRGAIRRNGSLQAINNLLGTITLNGNARIVLGTQTGFADAGKVNLNGFTLVKASSGILYCKNTIFYGADGTTDNPGNIIVEGGTLFLHNGNALKGGSSANKITLKDGTKLKLRHSGPLAWTIEAEGDATVISDDENPADQPRNRLAGPVTVAKTLAIEADKSNSIMSLKDGPVTLNGALEVKGPGSVSFVDAAVANTAKARATIENSNVANLAVQGASIMQGSLNDGYGQTRFYIGETAESCGTLAIDDNAVVKNYALRLGGNGAGAIYQRAGSSHWYTGEAANDRIASAAGSYGYIGQSGGNFALTAKENGTTKTTLLGVNGKAAFSFTGGTAAFNNSDNIAFAYRAGPLVWFQNGGSVVNVDKGLDFGDTASRNYAGRCEVTVAGKGSALKAGKWLRFFWENIGAEAFVNLNDGGTLETQYLYRLSDACNWYLNLNGGVIKPTLAGVPFTYVDEDARKPTAATVYEDGFVIDTSSCVDSSGSAGRCNMHLSFASPGEGKRVAAVALPDLSSEKNLVGSPVVTIAGDGAGASAFALFDDALRTVSSIVVTSSGRDYTSATATLSGGGLSHDYTCAVTLDDQPVNGWKGFTKRGAQRLDMYGANTFKGDVAVEEGILGFLNNTAPQGGMPQGAGVSIADGAVLTFPEKHTAVSVPFMAGCGRTSYGDFTVSDRIECSTADLFSGKFLKVNEYLTLAAGARIKITDPENMARYRKASAGATVLTAGAENENEEKIHLACQGAISLDLGEEYAKEAEAWRLAVKGNSIVFKPLTGLLLIVR